MGCGTHGAWYDDDFEATRMSRHSHSVGRNRVVLTSIFAALVFVRELAQQLQGNGIARS
jgi:hypothetical protein